MLTKDDTALVSRSAGLRVYGPYFLQVNRMQVESAELTYQEKDEIDQVKRTRSNWSGRTHYCYQVKLRRLEQVQSRRFESCT